MGPRSMLPALLVVLVLVCAMLATSPVTVALLVAGAAGGALAATYTLWRLLPPTLQPLVRAVVRHRLDEVRRRG